jgi:3-methylcrotonyl-CoA carboxylase alpha subunit
MIVHYRVQGQVRTVSIERSTEGYRVVLDGRPARVALRHVRGPRVEILIDGRLCGAYAVRDHDRRVVQLDGSDPVTLERTIPGRDGIPTTPAGEGLVAAVMDGQVVAVGAKEGDLVPAGAALVVLEAMKMEIRVVAPFAGRVRRLHCAPGDVVERGRTLVEIEPAGAGQPGCQD